MGDQNPVCASRILLPYLADLKSNMIVSIIVGNHGFENPQLNTEDALNFKKRSIALVSKLVEDFIQRTSIAIRKN